MTTDSTVLEYVSLYMLFIRLRKTLSLSYLLLHYTSGMSVDDGKCVLGSCGSFVLTDVSQILILIIPNGEKVLSNVNVVV